MKLDLLTNLERGSYRWRAANAVALVGLAFFVLYFLTGFRSSLFTDEQRLVDFIFWYGIPPYILDQHRYPASVSGDWIHAVFSYPPSGVVMMLPLQLASRPVAFVCWLVLQIVTFVTVLWTAMRLSGVSKWRCWPWLALIAALLAQNALSWDFRNHSTNLVYLALVMLGVVTRKTWLSGLLFALSANLKIYSVFLLPALTWRREYRLMIVTAVAGLLIAVFLPMMAFGPVALPQIFADWLEQIRYAHSPVNQYAGAATLIRPVAMLLSAAPTDPKVAMVVYLIQAGWIVLVVGYFLAVGRSQPSDPLARSQARLADVCVALMAPLPLSIWFIPYHAVPLFPAFILLLGVMVTHPRPTWMRNTALAACIATQVMRLGIASWDYRGVVYLSEFVIIVFAFAIIRRGLMQDSGAQVAASS